jgi:hypothetical protein
VVGLPECKLTSPGTNTDYFVHASGCLKGCMTI